VMLNLAMMAYAFPALKARGVYNQRLSIASFWLMCGGMAVMTLALAAAGAMQVYLQRILGQTYMDVQDGLAVYYWIRLGCGLAVVVAALMFAWSVLVPGRTRSAQASAALQPAE
jgi:nitric oxide reductase subunit B